MNRQNIILAASAGIATALAMLAVPALGQLVSQGGQPATIAATTSQDIAPVDSRVLPVSQGAMQQSFSPVVRKTAPAVVNVFSSVNVTRSNCPYANDPFWAQVYCNASNSQIRSEKVDNSLGSGVIVGSDGVIVTNNHVVEGGQEFRVVLNDRREFPAQLVMKDERSDLAVLRIDAGSQPLPMLNFADTRNLQIGDLVLAIGNPFGVGRPSPAASSPRWPAPTSAHLTSVPSSRLTHRSTRATPAAHSSTWKAGWSA